MNKKLIISGTAFLLLTAFARAQAPVGLDSIIVEKYYVSDFADKAVDGTGGVLPLNSYTYRIYVDMKPGYNFQAAYGVDVAPTNVRNAGDHELRFQTSTLFFNNEDRGDMVPSYSKTNAGHNTVMLDSWFSVGAACSGSFGILKAEDNGIANVVNTDGVLLNNDVNAGIPLTTQDGLITTTVTPEPVNFVGFSLESAMLNAQNDGTNGPLISTYNGSWASLNHSMGPDANNRVLIAQITTDGNFSFMLNIQLGTPTVGGVENWVANSPVGNEGTHSTLTYSNSPNMPLAVNTNKNSAVAFNVYPNPANDALTIDITKTTQGADNSYTIYGVDGKVVLSKKMGAITDRYQEKVDLSSLAPGLYFVEVSLDGVRSTKKITKN